MNDSNITTADVKAYHAKLVQAGQNDDREFVKTAANTSTQFLQRQSRVDGMARAILPPETITAADLSEQVDSEDPVLIRHLAPDSAGAMTMSFGGAPSRMTIHAPKYIVALERLITPAYTADDMQLIGQKVPVVKIKGELMKRDFLATEDSNFIARTNTAVGPMYDGTNASEVMAHPHWQLTESVGCLGVAASASRDVVGLIDTAMAYNMPGGIPSQKVLMNIVTYSYWKYQLDRTTVGGDMAQQFLFDKKEYESLGQNTVVKTINRVLVPDNVIFIFAAPDKMGVFAILQDITVEIQRDAYFFNFFAHGVQGMALGNIGGVKKMVLGGWGAAGNPTGWTITDDISG